MESLKCDHENVVYYSEEVFKANDHLQNKVKVLDAVLENVDLKSHVEKSARQHKTREVKQEVIEHKVRIEILENQVQSLNIQLNELKLGEKIQEKKPSRKLSQN